MLRINLIAVGRLKECFWLDACAEYLKRLGRYAKVSVIEIADRDPASNGGEAAARMRETADIVRRLSLAPALQVAHSTANKGVGSQDSYTVLFDRVGDQLSSEDIALLLSEIANAGKSTLNVILGGSTGVDANQLIAVQKTISFGRITLPHNLARVVCLEQLYRACKINAGEPYHK